MFNRRVVNIFVTILIAPRRSRSPPRGVALVASPRPDALVDAPIDRPLSPSPLDRSRELARDGVQARSVLERLSQLQARHRALGPRRRWTNPRHARRRRRHRHHALRAREQAQGAADAAR